MNLVPSQIRDQGKLGLCWAFSALAAVESNYMVGVSVDSQPFVNALYPDSDQENPHASELYLGWFARYHPDHNKSYLVFSTTGTNKRLLSLSELRDNPLKVLKGANWKVPVANFDVAERKQPEKNGAWLIRNSWGENARNHQEGYFYMSYEQFVNARIYTVESADDNLVCYDWDPLGWCSSWQVVNSDAYAVNVFKTGNEPVTLKRIGFYTCEPKTKVTLYVFNYNSETKPTESTVWIGEEPVSTDVYYEYAGYHTYKLDDTQSITIPANSYFSVGIKVHNDFDDPSSRMRIAGETRLKGYSDYAQVFDGESFFSRDGISWTDGTKLTRISRTTGEPIFWPMNACIKAFVTNSTGELQPEPESADMTIDGKLWSERPTDTVNEATLRNVNNPLTDDDVFLVGQNIAVRLLDKNNQYLPEGTQATLNFLFMGEGESYDLYYVDEDEDDDGKQAPISDNTKPSDPEGEKFYGVGGANSGCDFELGGLAVIVGLAVLLKKR